MLLNKYLHRIKIKSNQHKILIQNFSYLSILQVLSLLIPLISYPYLIRVVGKETYGLVIFSRAIVEYLVILVEFGFNISATKEVSIHRNDKKKLSEIVSSVLIIKGALFLASVVILSILVFLIPQAEGYEKLFLLSLWPCFYNFIFPIWFFQGIEKMKYITYITLLSRLIFLSLIFVFIHSPNDYLFIPIINGIGCLVAGIVSLYIIFKLYNVKFKLQSVMKLKYYIKESIPIFISNISIKLYSRTNKVIVGSFLGMAEVSYYDLAEKISNLARVPLAIIEQTVFPKVANEKNKNFVRKMFYFTILFMLIFIIILLFFSTSIVSILGGEDMLSAIPVLRILILTILPVTCSLFLANINLLAWGMNKEYLKLRFSTFIIYVVLFIVIYLFNYITIYSVSFILLFTEIFTALFALIIGYKKGNNFFKNPKSI